MVRNADILLVEDNPDDEELTLISLEQGNYRRLVHVVHDGVEAIEYFWGQDADARRSYPKLVLLDLKLPRVSGLEVLERLKTDERTKNIPVVVLTSSNQEPDINHCYRLGANSYIVKPVEFDAFQDTIHRLGLYWIELNKTPYS
jgi:CheY-like chemotaxis protein